METNKELPIRRQAMHWWNSLGFAEQKEMWQQWKIMTNDARKSWHLIIPDYKTFKIF